MTSQNAIDTVWAVAKLGLETGQGAMRLALEGLTWPGNAGAKFEFGRLYANGTGLPRNERETGRWYRRAADLGLPDAQLVLGDMYAYGWGVPQDDDEAARWYKEGADQGHALAQYSLAWLYADGKGVPQDDGEAVRLFRLAASQGHAHAQAALGSMYMSGRSATVDAEEAARWLWTAVWQGNDDARVHLSALMSLPQRKRWTQRPITAFFCSAPLPRDATQQLGKKPLQPEALYNQGVETETVRKVEKQPCSSCEELKRQLRDSQEEIEKLRKALAEAHGSSINSDSQENYRACSVSLRSASP
jgi:TPR repeat protein